MSVIKDFIDHFRYKNKNVLDFKGDSLIGIKGDVFVLQAKSLNDKDLGFLLEIIPQLYFICGGEYSNTGWTLLDKTVSPIKSLTDVRIGTKGAVDIFAESKSLPKTYLFTSCKKDKSGTSGMDFSKLYQFKGEKMLTNNPSLFLGINCKPGKQSHTKFDDVWSPEEGFFPEIIIQQWNYFYNELENCGFDLKAFDKKHFYHDLPLIKSKDPSQEFLIREVCSKLQDYDTVYANVIMRRGKSFISAITALRMGYTKICILTHFPTTLNEQWRSIFENHEDFRNFDLICTDDDGVFSLKNKDKFVLIVSGQFVKMGNVSEKFPDLFDTEFDFFVIDEVHRDKDTKRSQEEYSKLKAKKTLELSGTMQKLIAEGKVNPNACVTWDYLDNEYCKQVKTLVKKNIDPSTLEWDKYNQLQSILDENINPNWNWEMFDENWSPSIELVIYDVDPIIRKYAEENGLDHLEETASSLFRKHPDGSYPLLKEVLQTQMGPETKELEKNYTHRLYNGVDEHFTRDISIFTPRSKAHHDIVKSVLGSMIDDYKLLTPKIAPIVRLENNIHSFGAYIKDPELRLYNKLKKLQEFQKDTPNCFVLCQTGFIGFTFKKLCKILILRDLKDWCTFMQMAYRCMTPDDNSERSYPRKVVIYSSGLTFVHTLQKHISQGCKTEKEVGEKLEKFLRVFKIYLGDKPLDVATFNKKMSEMYAFNLDRVATNIALNYGIGDAFDTSGVKGSIRGVTVKGTIGDPSKGKAKSSGDNGDDNDDDEENGDEELTDEEKIGKSKEALLSKMFILNTAFVCLYKSDKEPWVLNKDSMFDVVDKFNDEDKLLFKDSTGHDWNEVNTKWFTPVVRNNLNAGMMINNYWIGCRDKRREGLSLADIIERDEHNIKLFGDVKTPVELVNTILDKIPEEIFRDSNKTFIDNACGMGTFLLESAKRRLKNGLDKQTVAKTTFGVDIRKKNVVVTIMELCRLLGEENRKLIEHNIVCADSLEFDYWNGMKFDVILNNPKKSNAIKFFEHSIKLLKSDGLLISIQSFSWIEDRKNMEHSYKMLKTKCGNRVSLIYVFNGNFYFEMGSFTPSCFIVLNNKKKDSSVLVENEINGKITIYSNIFSVNKFDNEFLYIPLENKILKYANASNIKQLIGIENGNIEVTLPFIVGNWNNLKCEIEKPNFYNMVNSSVEICEHKSSKKGLKFYFKTKNEAQNFVRYLKTKFARFCLSIYKINQNIHRGELGSIPIINFDNFIDEKDLYKKFNIKDDEIEFIKSSIKD